MKKYILFFLLGYILTIISGIPLSVAQNSNQSQTACEVWSQQPSSVTNGKVCTDLLEGIPMSIADQPPNSCYQYWDTSKPRPDPNICYAVISPTGIGGFMSFIAMIYRYASWAIGILAVLVIIIGGITMSIGGASQESVTKGKKLIFQAIGGVILFFLIGVILHTINPNFF
jgi:hypothetical protein